MAAMPLDLTRTTLAILFLVGLIAGTRMVLAPFLPALIWAATLATATWPLLLRVQRLVGGSRRLAVLILTMAMLALVAVPLWIAIRVIVSNATTLLADGQLALNLTVPPPPAWLATLPVIGARLTTAWERVVGHGTDELAKLLKPYLGRIANWLLGEVSNLGLLVVQFLLTVILTALLYAKGETLAIWVHRFAERIAAGHGGRSVSLVAQAVRSVALGVVVTALAQTLVGALGLMLVDIPYPGFLTALMLIFCLGQLGPGPVLVPAVVWVYLYSDLLWTLILAVITGVSLVLDNVLRPILMGRGLATPMILVFAGVVGGLFAFGPIGMFVGPAILAVSYALLVAWIGEAESAPPVPVEARRGANRSATSARKP